MTGGLTLGAALLLGLAASGHCLVMCGGISAALGMATARRADGRPRPLLLIGYQFGRMLSYALAGLLLGGALGALLGWFELEAMRRGLRVLAATALLLAALVAFGRIRPPRSGAGGRLWSKLAPLGRRLLPVNSLPRALCFGMIWGWMPCGFVYTVLVIAALQLEAARAAAIMLAFGIGTAPAMIATALGASRMAAFTSHPAARHIAGAMLGVAAALTLSGPWLVAKAPGLHPWIAALCSVRAL